MSELENEYLSSKTETQNNSIENWVPKGYKEWKATGQAPQGQGIQNPIPPESLPKPPSLLRNLLSETWEGIKATPETALSTASGMIAWPISFVGGIGMTLAKGAEEGRAFEQFLMEHYSYQPKGKTAQEATGKIGSAMETMMTPAKWVGEIAEKLGATPEGQFYMEKVGELGTLMMLPKAGKTAKKAFTKTRPWEKPVTPFEIKPEATPEEPGSGTAVKGRTPLSEDLAAREAAGIKGEESARIMEDLNLRAHDEIQAALEKIPEEEWAKVAKSEKPVDLNELFNVIDQGVKRIEKAAKEQPNLPEVYRRVIEREKEDLKARAENLKELAKEADQAGQELIVVPEVLKPRETVPLGAKESVRPLGEIARDLKAILPSGEKGAIGDLGVISPEKQAAYGRLKKDFQVIARNAKRVGKPVENYLLDLGIDKEIIQYMAREAQAASQEQQQKVAGAEARGAKAAPQPTVEELPPPRVNLDRIIATDEVKNIIAEVNQKMQTSGRIEETTRGVRHHEQTFNASLTKKGGTTVEEILMRKPGEIWNAEKTLAARNIRDAVAVQIDEMMKRAEAGDIIASDSLDSAIALFGEIEAQRTGASAEIGRALESHKIPSESTYVPFAYKDLSELAALVKGANIPRDVLIQRLRGLKNVEQQASFARQFVNGLKKGVNLFNFAWINGLLSGPPTHVVNFISNGATFLGAIAERELASRIGQVGELFGKQPGVIPGESGAMIHGAINGFMEALDVAKQSWVENKPRFGGEKTEIVRNPLSQEQLGTSGSLGNALEFLGNVIGGPGRALMTADEFWKAMNYRAELQARAFREATAEGLTGKQFGERVNYIVEHPDRFEMIDQAARDFAGEQTFTKELGQMGKAVQGLANATPFTKLVLPFVKTPTNILKYSWERTPGLNLISSCFWSDIAAGGPQADLALAKMGMGVMAVATVMYLADAGYITGNGPYDKKLRNIWLNDHQPYSIKVGDKWVAYDRMDPASNVFGVAADTVNMINDLDLDTSYQVFSAMALAMSNMMINKTYLRGLSDVLQAVKEPEQGAEKYVKNFARSLVPTISRVVNRALMDDVVRESNGIVDSIKAGIPGMSEDLPPKRNFWGDPIAPEGSLGPDMLSPYKVKTEKKNAVNEEILANRIPLFMPNKHPGGYNPSENPLAQERESWGIKLDPEQYDRFVVLARKEVEIGGANLHERLSDLIKTRGYQNQSTGPDGMRALLITSTIREYDQFALQILIKEFPDLGDKMIEKQQSRARALMPSFR